MNKTCLGCEEGKDGRELTWAECPPCAGGQGVPRDFQESPQVKEPVGFRPSEPSRFLTLPSPTQPTGSQISSQHSSGKVPWRPLGGLRAEELAATSRPAEWGGRTGSRWLRYVIAGRMALTRHGGEFWRGEHSQVGNPEQALCLC